jgi:FlaA1/EpsC-like NDP-sugar epimerase
MNGEIIDQTKKSFIAIRPVMVTGGAGFIGSALVHYLCAQGARESSWSTV